GFVREDDPSLSLSDEDGLGRELEGTVRRERGRALAAENDCAGQRAGAKSEDLEPRAPLRHFKVLGQLRMSVDRDGSAGDGLRRERGETDDELQPLRGRGTAERYADERDGSIAHVDRGGTAKGDACVDVRRPGVDLALHGDVLRRPDEAHAGKDGL